MCRRKGSTMESLIVFLWFLFLSVGDTPIDGAVKLPNQAANEYTLLFSQTGDADDFYDACDAAPFDCFPPFEFSIDGLQLMTAVQIDTNGAEPFGCSLLFGVTCI